MALISNRETANAPAPALARHERALDDRQPLKLHHEVFSKRGELRDGRVVRIRIASGSGSGSGSRRRRERRRRLDRRALDAVVAAARHRAGSRSA